MRFSPSAIKNHHEPESIEEQILSMADIYSALREKRCYKTEMTKKQALEVIAAETEQGKFHSCVYQALVDYANMSETLSKKQCKDSRVIPRQGFCIKILNVLRRDLVLEMPE